MKDPGEMNPEKTLRNKFSNLHDKENDKKSEEHKSQLKKDNKSKHFIARELIR